MTKTATVQAQQRWEYMTISRKTETYLAGELNTLGEEGWELVTINYAKGKKEEMFWTAFLKRPAVGHVAQASAQTTAAAQHDSAHDAPKSFESLEGIDLEGETFAIHEEPRQQATGKQE